MILLDYSQTVIGSFMAMSKGGGVVEEDILRHIILNTIRQFRNQFTSQYGEIIICCDHYKNWRKEVFPEYKANRRPKRDSDPVDWQHLFDCLNIMRDDLTKHFPYKVVYVEGAEADDIIGVLVHHYKEVPTLILSSDKDFIQLHIEKGIDQWSPLQKKFVGGNPQDSLYEKLIKGDTGDGVPNILSADDTFVTENKRQRPITQKKLDAWKSSYVNGSMKESFDGWTDEMYRNFYRNKTMVDLGETPESIRLNIITNYESQELVSRADLLNYFVSKRLKNLMEHIEEF